MDVLLETKGIARTIGLKLEATSVQKIDQILRGIAEGLRDFRAAWHRISTEVLLPSIDTAFANQTSQDGTPWAPLSAAYAARKKGGRILERSGKLRRALTSVDFHGTGAIRRFGKKSALIGTSLIEGAPIQYGYGSKSASTSRAVARGKKNFRTKSLGRRAAVPPRSFIGWNDAMREEATGIMIEELEKIVDAQVANAPGVG